ncbi:uncharacterized protein BDZ99DRAFT_515838 [Mytilinidion resinicola]|uniref:F-box domain-containing protein n=1 Tax=Mytilinidion resinicola TaxID=574789 RepID=A0A6A6Z1P0_9PEZI|nr:uncharacterized protein BDZ99DRAFT_515838 [Mytilinidion resinicola]KAF2815082.1 hypothetical protein BDZ99DRAFT_515838 [Mytilinidion resinicola]
MSTLLALPAELRNQIYRYVFTSRDHLTQSIKDPRATFPTHVLSLLLTCHQVHQEAALLAFSTTSFLTASHRARALLSALKASAVPPHLVRSITSLTIAAHLIPSLVYPRALSLFLENIAQVAAALPALDEIAVLFERCGAGAGSSTDLRSILQNKLPHILSLLRDLMPSARFELRGQWTGEPAPARERRERERGVYLLTFKKDGEDKERVLRVEFLGCWPQRTDALYATEVEVEEALAADPTSGWDLKRRERPFLTAAVTDPAEKMRRHRSSLGSSVGDESPGWSSPRGHGSPRSSLGFGSPRSSLGGEWSSPGRRSVGSSSQAVGGSEIGRDVSPWVQCVAAIRAANVSRKLNGEEIE